VRRALALALCLSPAALAAEKAAPPPIEEPIETPILVPTPIPVGFLVAWKPTILSVRLDTGSGAAFGSDKFQPLRGLFRYTTTTYGERILLRAEVEGGRFQSDTSGTRLGTDGWDATLRLLAGTATRIIQGFVVTGSAGLLTRYQRGSEAGSGAPRLGIFGVTSNFELEYRIAPVITVSGYLEGAIVPFPYNTAPNLGVLSDASEMRARLQFSIDVGTNTAVDVGYDFSRWHLSFDGSNALDPTAPPNQALLVEAREHAVTIGIRWKP
jgi:hypothetical protein